MSWRYRPGDRVVLKFDEGGPHVVMPDGSVTILRGTITRRVALDKRDHVYDGELLPVEEMQDKIHGYEVKQDNGRTTWEVAERDLIPELSQQIVNACRKK